MSNIIAAKATHILTINNEPRYVVAIAYRPDPSFDEAVEGKRIAPRLATEDEIKTGKSKSGKDVIVSLASPTVAGHLFETVRQYGYDGDYLGSTEYQSGPLGEEWGWNAGHLLSNGERPRANLTWDLEPVIRDERGEIANKIASK